jgi:hypothetical protein
MHEILTAVEMILARAGVMWTRLREQGAGDVLDLMPVEALALAGFAPPAVVAALVTLEQRGVVQRGCARVHPHDSSEYHVVWRLAREAPSRPARP